MKVGVSILSNHLFDVKVPAQHDVMRKCLSREDLFDVGTLNMMKVPTQSTINNR
jgi:hypothetical protein